MMNNRFSILNRLGQLLGLLGVVACFGVLRPETFLTAGNAEVMLTQTAVVGAAAIGMTFIIVSGGIDLSVGSAIALVTVVLARLLAAGLPPLPSAVLAVGAGALCGLLIGALVAGLRLAPFIVTLGAWGAYRGLAKGLAREQTVLAPTTWLNGLLQSVDPAHRFQILPWGVWLTLLLAACMTVALGWTRFGRHVVALGSNERTARLCGVPVSRVKVLIYLVAGIFTGVAGVLQFAYLSVGDPTTANGLELQIIAAVVIGGASLAGGQGSIPGTLIGAAIMTAVSNGCTKLGLANWIQEIVTGAIILLAVIADRLRDRRL